MRVKGGCEGAKGRRKDEQKKNYISQLPINRPIAALLVVAVAVAVAVAVIVAVVVVAVVVVVVVAVVVVVVVVVVVLLLLLPGKAAMGRLIGSCDI